ncbi:MAG: hypothetical protein IJJ17_02845 [Parasporobacterium sp.]|nr:hypothetical protein [Parasporobacterium sp.]
MKRVLAILMAVVFCVSMLSLPAFAEPAPEGGSEGGPGLQTEEYEITVDGVTDIAHYQDLESNSEQRSFVITFNGADYTGKIDKGVWTADDPAGDAVIAAYQQAHESDPSFMGPPPAGDSPEGESPEGQAPEGGSPEGESPEGQAPEGGSPEGQDPAEGEQPAGESEGESGEGESAGESASSGGSASPMQDIILTDGAEEVYENIDWEGTGGYLALLGATARVGGDEDNYQVEGLLVPVTQEYFDASAVQFDGGVNSVFTGTQDATGGGATFNVTGEGSALYVNNAYISSQGSQTAAMYTDETNNKVVVKDSYLESYGSVPGYEDVMDFIALQGLLSWGHTRTNLSQGITSTYYYNSAVVADGWAAMSTDGAQGLGVNFVAVNSYAETTDGGYAIYSDHECRDYVLGTTLVGAEYGAIIAAGGELYLLDGEAVDPAATELNGWRQAFMDAHPANLMNTSYQDFAAEHPVVALEEYDGEPMEIGRTTIVGGRNCVLMHKPDEQHEGLPAASQNVLYAKGTDFIVDEALFDLNAMPEGWYTPEDVTSSASFFNDDTLNYVYFTSGAAILMRSCSTLVYLDDVTYTNNYGSTALGYDDLFLLSVINSDGNANLIPDGEQASPMDITVANSEINGNIADMDYQREMLLNFDNSTLNGWIKWVNCEGWNEIWGENGILGHGAYAYDESYETVWGPVVSLTNGSKWIVTEESYVKDLYVDETSEVVGNIEVFENGCKVTPLEGEAVAEDAAAAGDTSEEAYHAYLKEFVDAVPAVSDEHLPDFFALIDASDYTTMPADMMFNPQWWGYAAMTYDEFVAAGGVYEIPAFDPNLVPD